MSLINHQLIDTSKYVAFDIESFATPREFALQPWRGSDFHVRSWALAQFDASKIVTRFEYSQDGLYPDRQKLSDVLTRLADAGKTVVAWNAPYDIACLMAMGLYAEAWRVNWLDGMLIYKRVHTNRLRTYSSKDEFKGFGLKQAVAEYLPAAAGYGDAVDLFIESLTPEQIEELKTYNVNDARFTLVLTMWLMARLSEDELRNARIESASLVQVAQANMEGLKIDQKALDDLDQKLQADSEKAYTQLLASEPAIAEINLGSPAQVSGLLFDTWGLPCDKQTPTGARSTDKEVLHNLAVLDPRAKLLQDYREAQGNRVKFVETIQESLLYNGDGLVRPQARVYSTYTGRMTYSSTQGKGKNEKQIGFALHQMKRDPAFRKVIVAPPGYVLAEFDFAGQEFRWMAVESGDETMLSLCQPGEDAHGYMGAQIGQEDYRDLVEAVHTGDKEAKRLRQMGKVANLSCVAAGQKVLTDRGFVRIEQVTRADLLWDGVQWVEHSGVVYMGDKHVITHGGVTATPDHRVLTDFGWVEIQEAARQGWRIKSSLGTRWPDKAGAALRLVGGFIRRAVFALRRTVRDVPVRMWCREGSESATRDARCKPTKQATYDILDAGVRNRFSVGFSLVHNCQYRTSAKTLRVVANVQHGVPLSEADAGAVHRIYRNTYQDVPIYWDKQIAFAKQHGYVVTQAGRKVDLPGPWTRAAAWSLESTAINFPIQGVGADQKYLALLVLKNYLPQVGGRFLFELHDGIFLLLPEGKASSAAQTIKGLLSNLPYKKAWGKEFTIKFPVDAKLGQSWGDLKEV